MQIFRENAIQHVRVRRDDRYYTVSYIAVCSSLTFVVVLLLLVCGFAASLQHDLLEHHSGRFNGTLQFRLAQGALVLQ